MNPSASKKVDFLIVGQGIAGTILAHFLLEAGRSVHIIDDANPNSSTAVAAGLINPVTGRHFVKSWRVEEFLPTAVETYRALEQKFDTKLYHSRNIIRAIFNAGEQNEWLARTTLPGYDRFVVEPADAQSFDVFVSSVYDFIEIGEGAKVDVGQIITLYRDYFKSRECYTQTKFDHNQLKIEADGIEYEGLQAGKIIFAEGAAVKNNPFFNYLPFLGDKGEVLIIKIKDTGFEKILKHKVYIIPTGEPDTYWVGATMQRDFENPSPTTIGYKQLVRKLEKVLTVPFEVIDHQAAVRPTVRDRRPFIGPHPVHEPLFLFNGMGSKGTSLVPFWAKHTVDHLLNGTALDKEINVKKYERYFE
jgi:glycine oxidase